MYPGGRCGNNSRPHEKTATHSPSQGVAREARHSLPGGSRANFAWGRKLLPRRPPGCTGVGSTSEHHQKKQQKMLSPTSNRLHSTRFVKTSAPRRLPTSGRAVLTDFLKKIPKMVGKSSACPVGVFSMLPNPPKCHTRPKSRKINSFDNKCKNPLELRLAGVP